MSARVNPSVVAPWRRLCGSIQAKAWDVFNLRTSWTAFRGRHHREGSERGRRADRWRAVTALRPDRIHHVVVALTQGELSEDPGDFVATHLPHTASGLTGNTVLFGAVYLLAHGVVKVALAIAMLLNKIWAYPWMIAVLVVSSATSCTGWRSVRPPA